MPPTAVNCTVDDNCSDSSKYDETIKIARCNKTIGLCECILPLCFNYNSDANQCELKRCHKIVLSNDGKAIECINQGAKSKTTALYLEQQILSWKLCACSRTASFCCLRYW